MAKGCDKGERERERERERKVVCNRSLVLYCANLCSIANVMYRERERI